MDILAKHDQENLVHNLHAAAAGKSLNAGLKGFNAKTPGNKAPKTPFHRSLNDENATFKAGKSVLKTNGKGNENLLMTMKKGGKLDDNAFVTPAGPRNRAPLGMKTTNAKAKAFQTPAPLSGSAKTQKISPRLRRPKVKVHQPELEDEEKDNIPEVEYMPPKEVPLPEAFDDDMPPINWDFPQLKSAKFNRSIYNRHNQVIEDDGRTRGEREAEEELAMVKKESAEEADRLFAEVQEREQAEARRYLGIESPKKAAPEANVLKKKAQAPSTIKARSAAAALSPAPKPSYAAPTAVVKSRLPTMLASRKPAQPAINPSATRNATAAAASKSTIGYARGRSAATTTTARKPLSNVTRPPSRTLTTKRPTTASSNHTRTASSASISASTYKSRGPISRSSSTSTTATLVTPQPSEQPYRTAEDVENEMRLLIEADDDDADDAWMNSFNSQLNGDPFEDEHDGFQFQLPEGL
ncbi:hypothetical protein B0J11DRAFT_521685 [Dendryphion nanum]|uniref:Uncharacterized protein n=1 Tax=Dendryphion nanum TaxID=256645 RepID=A0A9P9E893_9PLEO|nr:hypothetical protein B0J11DRAFT_521685 [Dendryphion nanum]